MRRLIIQILVGSIREGRKSLPVAQWVGERAALREEFQAELVDLADWSLPMLSFAKPPAMGLSDDATQRRWAAKIAAADGLVEGGHSVVGTTRDPKKARNIADLGGQPAVVDCLDSKAVMQAVLAAKPDVVVHQLTALAAMKNLKRFDDGRRSIRTCSPARPICHSGCGTCDCRSRRAADAIRKLETAVTSLPGLIPPMAGPRVARRPRGS